MLKQSLILNHKNRFFKFFIFYNLRRRLKLGDALTKVRNFIKKMMKSKKALSRQEASCLLNAFYKMIYWIT